MSSPSINSVLSQAYGLIEADQLADAVALLKPMLAEHPSNADAWWLYAHAVTDVDDARAALQTTLQLDPQYPEAQRLLMMLDEASSGALGAGNPLNDVDMQPIRTIPDLPPVMPEAEEEEMPDFEREAAFGGSEREASGSRTWLTIAILAALFLCAIIGALLLTRNVQAPGDQTQVAGLSQADIDGTMAAAVAESTLLAGLSEAELGATMDFNATAVIESVTLTAQADGAGGGSLTQDEANMTATAIIESVTAAAQAAGTLPTQELATPSGVDASVLQPIAAAFASALGEGNSTVNVEATGLGANTLVFSICTSEPGVDLNVALRQAVGVLVGQGDLLRAGFSGAGFRLQNCESGEIYRLLTARMNDVLALAGSSMDAVTFVSRLTAE